MAKRDRKQRAEEGERRGPELVLLAGDVADANELLSRFLTSRGYRVTIADSVESGVAAAVDEHPRVAVIDLSSRGIGSSLKLLESIRSHDDEVVQRIRVVIVARSRANRTFSFQAGADGFLLRPYHADELVELIEMVLAVPGDELPVHRRQMIDS